MSEPEPPPWPILPTTEPGPSADKTVRDTSGSGGRRFAAKVRAAVSGWWALVWVGALLVTSLSVIPVMSAGAEGVVTDFFTALQDKDVEGALDLIDQTDAPIPYGAKAVFLHPDAIADGWELVDVAVDTSSAGSGEEPVDVTLSVGGDIETGTVTATDMHDGWRLKSPFIDVSFGVPPTDYLQLNDRTVELSTLHPEDTLGWKYFPNVFPVFPGPAGFFAHPAGAVAEPGPVQTLWPSDGNFGVPPISVSFTDEVQDRTQDAVDRLVDDCAEFKVGSPSHCPFGNGDSWLGEPDNPRDVDWTVESYPSVELVGHTPLPDVGFGIVTTDPGKLRMTGVVDSGHIETECGVDTSTLYATVSVDGEVSVFTGGEFGTPVDDPAPAMTCDDFTEERLKWTMRMRPTLIPPQPILRSPNHRGRPLWPKPNPARPAAGAGAAGGSWRHSRCRWSPGSVSIWHFADPTPRTWSPITWRRCGPVTSTPR